MKIKSINDISFEISLDTISVVTDPLSFSDFGLKLPKTECDVVLLSDEKYLGKEDSLKDIDKLVGKNREKIFEINGAGEYEVGQMLIQRPSNSQYYILDSGYARVVYIGLNSKNIDVSMVKDMGDVEVLIAPVGDGDRFVSYEKLQDIIAEIEPAMLIPYGFKTDSMKSDLNLKTKDEFMKHFGYTNSREEKMVKIAGKIDSEESTMEVVFLS